MKIEKLNKENVKEFIRDMKLENTENFELNIDKNEIYGVKKEDMFLISFDSLSLVDTIAILHYNPKLSDEMFYECIEFLNKSLVVQNHLIIEVFDKKYAGLLENKYKCKEMDVMLELVPGSYSYTNEKSNVKEKFVDIEMNSIKYNSFKGNIVCNFVKQNITDEKLILDLHAFFAELDINYILYTIYEDSYEYLGNLGYKWLCKRYVIRN